MIVRRPSSVGPSTTYIVNTIEARTAKTLVLTFLTIMTKRTQYVCGQEIFVRLIFAQVEPMEPELFFFI